MSDFDQLRILTELKYARSQDALRTLAQREQRLRAELARLDDNLRKSRGQSPGDAPMRSIGADVIWQGWVDRAKTQINLELARVLSEKEAKLAHARKAYGRVLVSQKLAERDAEGARDKRRKDTLAKAIEASLIHDRGRSN